MTKEGFFKIVHRLFGHGRHVHRLTPFSGLCLRCDEKVYWGPAAMQIKRHNRSKYADRYKK